VIRGISWLAVAAVLATTAAKADIDSGAYLAGRTAALNNDFVSAARYFTISLRRDPGNREILENAMAAHAAVGNLDAASRLAIRLWEQNNSSQVSSLVIATNAAKNGQWADILEAMEAGRTISPLVDGLAQAWAFAGVGDTDRAMATFEDVAAQQGMNGFGTFHSALFLASIGEFEQADAILGAAGRQHDARSAFAHAQILSQLGRNEDAIALLQAVFGSNPDPSLTLLLSQLGAGVTVPFDTVRNPQDGMAEVMYLVARLVRQETPESYTLLYTRMAEALRPDFTPAILLSGELLEALEQFDLASETYARISTDDPAYASAELGRIEVLRRAGKLDAGIEAAQNLARSHGHLPAPHDKLGDMLRYDKRYADAIPAYTQAISLLPEGHGSEWLLHYKRAISYHMTDDWPLAEADFRSALELNPDQPLVLNYLGYSLVERGEKLDEALEMIEKAVRGAPENGAIIDSLGWVLFQLGRYDESVAYMEQAASLEAVDPIVNDHLGDVYWAVGRKIEADFQWNRALSFNPEPELAERIRLKLEIGLDALLEQEGSDPLQVSDN